MLIGKRENSLKKLDIQNSAELLTNAVHYPNGGEVCVLEEFPADPIGRFDAPRNNPMPR